MKRRWLAALGGLALAACGLSVTGLAPLEGIDAGVHDDAAVVETGAEPIDSTTPPPPNCHIANACDGGLCILESCQKAGSDHFADYSGGGGKVTMDAGTCVAVTTAKGQTSALRGELTNVPLHYAYRFDANVKSDEGIGVLIFGTHDHPEKLKGFAFMFMGNGAVTVCRTTPGLTDGGVDCPKVHATISDAGVYFRVSGEVDRRDGGNATLVLDLADSPTSCAEALRVEVAGPYEDRINFGIGCNGASCSTAWDEARLEVSPLP